MDPRLELITKVRDLELLSATSGLPVVSLEDFFQGNSDVGSIGCNLIPHPGPQFFFEVLKAVRGNAMVQDVLVEVNEIVNDPETWPFSDRVYVLSSATADDIRSWLKTLQPDDVTEGWANGTPPGAPAPKPGVKVYSVWWD
jgi:hypothetical protein